MDNKKCLEYVERDSKVIAKSSHLPYFPLVVDRALGSTIYDVDGNKFLDFLSSASSLNLGMNHPDVLRAVESQLKKCIQYTAAYSYNAPMIEYAERLVSVYPGKEPAKVCFGNCGSDANDAAVKFSRAYTGRQNIITFLNGYHGNTYGAMTLSTVTTKMRSKMGPFLPGVFSFPFSTCGKCPAGKCESDCNVECLDPMLNAFATYLPAEEVASMIIEPIQGDSGIIPASRKYMRKLYEICQKNGILFIAEEVQQAFGRCGRWFSIENYDIIPDGIVLGKSVGGGFPLGAFLAKTPIIDSLPAPAHVFTLSGNSISCAAGCAAFDVVAAPDFFDSVNQKGAAIISIFKELGEKYGCIGEMRGAGLSIGIEIVDPETRLADSKSTAKICYHSYENGLIMISLAGNVLRVQPPLVITEEEIKLAKTILFKVFDDLANGKIPDSVLENSKGW